MRLEGEVGWCRAPLMRNWRKVRRSNDRDARDWRGNRHQIPPCFYNVPAGTIVPLPFDPIPDTRASSVAYRGDPNCRNRHPFRVRTSLARNKPRIFRGRRLGALAPIP